MTIELHSLKRGFLNEYIVQDLLEEVTGHKYTIEDYVDSKKVLETVGNQGPTSDERLQIDGIAMRESLINSELSKISWLSGKYNPADALDKIGSINEVPFVCLITTNKTSIEAIGWESGDQK